MIVFLTEEASITPTIKFILSQVWSDSIEGVHWQIISFNGKADLERKAIHRMEAWSYNDPHFIILRDNDGADCAVLKQKLVQRVSLAAKPFHVRLVCQELEGWFLGDLTAIEAAYPASRATRLINRNPYRVPDNITNASQLLKELTQTSGKVGRSELISKHLDLSKNASHSFNLLITTIQSLIPQHS